MMTNFLIKTGAFLAFGVFAFTAPVLALSPLPLDSVPIIVPVQNVETEELKRDLETGDMAPEAAEGKAEEEKSSGAVEDEEVWRDLQTGDTPPPGR